MTKPYYLLPLAGLLAGCAVGPDFQSPPVVAPEQFARAQPGGSAAADSRFWHGFDDPQLSALVEQTLAANLDLRAGIARLDGANALLGHARLSQWPIVTAGGQVSQSHVDQDPATGAPRSHRHEEIGVQASWELDLFGRLRRAVESQRFEAVASAQDVAALQVALVGATARSYLQLRGLQERLRIAEAAATNQRATLVLVHARHGVGRGTRFDLARAQALLETTQARIPALEAEVGVAQHRLAVLTGQAPGALIAQLDAAAPLPAVPSHIGTDAPAALLRRRPDVAAAEARLHAATARIGVATADLFPRLSLGGLAGSDARAVTLGVDWSFLDVGRVRARIAASQADADQLLAGYQQTVLLALEETENALLRVDRTQREEQRLEQAAISQQLAARLAREQYRAGAIGLHETLDAERTLLSAEEAFSDSRLRGATAAVALFQAMAGGWP